jgi:ComF family protein
MLRLFLPETCIHCGNGCEGNNTQQISKYLCTTCLRQFFLFEPPIQNELRIKSPFFYELPFEAKIKSAFIFQSGGIIQSVIHHFKYLEMPRLAIILGKECHERNISFYTHYDFIVPVPLHRTRYSERGYNQSEMLAIGIGEAGDIPVAKRKWLKRTRQTPSQTGKTLEEREENVRGAFTLSATGIQELKGKRILLIDDVMTTGATLASAASALAIAKPKTVDVFAMATVIN